MSAPTDSRTTAPAGLVIAAVVAVGFNLRAAIGAVGPLVPTIRADLGVDNVAMGLVGALPVLAFGLVSPLAPGVGRRLGTGRALAAALLALAGALLLRSVGGYVWLLVGTVLLGVSVAVCNVLLPALVKARFPQRFGQLTSMYGTVMVVGATLSAAAAVPLARAFDWETSLAVWTAPALLGAAVVLGAVLASDRGRSREDRRDEAAARRAEVGVPAAVIHRSRLAWRVTAFMGLQSLVFYVVLAWLPDVLVERGLDDARAGALVSLLNLGGLVGILVVPSLAGRRRAQSPYNALAGGLTLSGTLLLLVPGTSLVTVACIVLGVGAGGTFGLALSTFGHRTGSARDAAALSGMAQTWGYLLAATGPVAFGALRDASASWTPALVVLAGLCLVSAVAGWSAGRDEVLQLPL